MIAVIFEVWPRDGQRDHYLDIAADLRPILDQVEGFISVERFQSITDPGKMLSVSFFEDEAALDRWRRMARHRKAQAEGRGGVFDDYRLRIAHVMRDYGMNDREQAPANSQAHHG